MTAWIQGGVGASCKPGVSMQVLQYSINLTMLLHEIQVYEFSQNYEPVPHAVTLWTCPSCRDIRNLSFMPWH